VFFCFEASIKIGTLGWKQYWANRWNRFDLFVIGISTPALLTPWMPELNGASVLLILRIGRLVRLVKLARFIPDGQRMWDGITRALRASVGLFGGLILLNLILALIAATLFGSIENSPTAQKAFENPIASFYTVFKVFTVEGWFEIPEDIAKETGNSGWGTAVRVYFMGAVLIGGFLGLSIVNAVFVDEMVKDNNEDLEKEIDRLRRQFEASVGKLITEQNCMLEHASAERLQLRMMLDQLQACVEHIGAGGGDAAAKPGTPPTPPDSPPPSPSPSPILPTPSDGGGL
jgi:voltage-gated sodium channel